MSRTNQVLSSFVYGKTLLRIILILMPLKEAENDCKQRITEVRDYPNKWQIIFN